jgi:hypothetical protein
MSPLSNSEQTSTETLSRLGGGELSSGLRLEIQYQAHHSEMQC